MEMYDTVTENFPEIPEGDIDVIRARHYFNDTDLSASVDGIDVCEHSDRYARNEFVVQYALIKDRALTNANAWLWSDPATLIRVNQ